MFSELIEAIKARNEIQAEKLIAKMDIIELSKLSGFKHKTALMLAIEERLEKICKLLIKKMPDEAINHIDTRHNNALHYAADVGEGLEEICKLLTKRMPDDEINRISSKDYTTLELGFDMKREKDKIFSVLINKVSENTINYVLHKFGMYGKEDDLRQKISYNNELVKKLALFLKSSFSDKNDLTDSVKIPSAVKFYEVANKNLLAKYLKAQEIDNAESILAKTDNFIKANPFLIKGVCKEIQPNFENLPSHLSYLSNELLLHIVSYLDDEEWGIDAEVKISGEHIIIQEI